MFTRTNEAIAAEKAKEVQAGKLSLQQQEEVQLAQVGASSCILVPHRPESLVRLRLVLDLLLEPRARRQSGMMMTGSVPVDKLVT